MHIRALSLLLLSGVGLWAQDTGRITGSVEDPSGAAVPKASINLLLHGGSAPVATTTSGTQGLFSLETLRPVYYDLTVDAAGFQQYKQENVKVDPSRATDLPPIKLQLSAAATSINVTAPVETVQTTSPAVSTTFTADQIDRLPIGDRYALSFITTQAGVAPTQFETNINGQRSSFTNVTLDGINVQDNYIRTGDLDFIPSQLTLSQVQEFTVTTSNQGADSGGGASQVNMTTPSGGNQLHGNVYWQNRINSFAANNWFDNQDGIGLPRLTLNQGGATVSGPIKRDKLFFFANYEAYRLRTEESENQTILTADARNGIFSYVDTKGAVQKANILNIVGLKPDPVMSSLLARVPGPENINNFRAGDSQPGRLLNTAGYSFFARSNVEKDNATGKLDYYLSTKHSLTGSYIWNRLTVDRPDVGIGYPAAGQSVAIPQFRNDDGRNFVSAAWRWNPSPNLTNEVRGGFYLAPGTFGFDGMLSPYFIGGTVYSTPDVGAASSTLAQGRNTNTFSAADNGTWARGRHTFKFGYFFQGVRVRTYDYSGVVPTYNVGISSTQQSQYLLFPSDLPRISANDLTNANELLASLTGLLDNADVLYNVTSQRSGFVPGAPYLRHFTYDNHAFYGQDQWKILKNLTLTAGVRWDYWAPVDERDSLELQPLLVNGSARDTLLGDSSLYFSGNSIGRPFYNKDQNDFGPDAGLAWDVFGNGKTSLRASYGLYYVNDEQIQVTEGFTGVNPGLQSPMVLTNLSGFMNTDRPALTAPAFQVPLTFDQGYAQDPFVGYALLDPSLRTPYVQQWNFSIQQDVKGTIIEGRYIGNHATKLLRGFDYNQEVLPANFLSDFLKAQQNGFLALKQNGSFNPAYNAAIPGSQPLPVFNTLPGRGFLNNGFVQSLIQSGEPAELGFVYTYNFVNGPLSFFPNPNALSAYYVNNYSNSTYDSVQLEVRRRLQRGLELQANYTFSKLLTDAAGTDQFRFQNFMDINNPGLDKARGPNDLTHQFKLNYVYELPAGAGHRLQQRWLNWLAGGWMTSGNLVWLTGNPFSIYSGRGTFLRESDSGFNEANSSLTKSQLDGEMKFRMTGNGPYFLPASAIGADGRGVAPDGQSAFQGQIFSNPGPGTIGTLQRRLFTGPSVFNMDAAVAKETKLGEHVRAELRLEALNVFNHPTFAFFSQNINSPQFGKITSTAFTTGSSTSGARQLQLGLKVSF